MLPGQWNSVEQLLATDVCWSTGETFVLYVPWLHSILVHSLGVTFVLYMPWFFLHSGVPWSLFSWSLHSFSLFFTSSKMASLILLMFFFFFFIWSQKCIEFPETPRYYSGARFYSAFIRGFKKQAGFKETGRTNPKASICSKITQC